MIVSIIFEIWIFETKSNYDYLILLMLYFIVIYRIMEILAFIVDEMRLM